MNEGSYGFPPRVSVRGLNLPVYSNSSITLIANTEYKLDTTSNPITATLPVSPILGDTIILIDPLGTWGVTNVTIDRNGKSIVDPYGTAQAENLILDQANMKISLFYDGTNWRLI